MGAGIIAAYTLLGGFWAVSLTDTLQGALMCVAAVALPIVGLNAVGGGEALADGLRLAGPNFVDLFDGAGFGGGIGLAVGLLGIGLGYPGQPHVVNRLMALSDERARVRGRRIAMSWALIVYSGMIVAGLCARVLLADLGDHENAFVALTQQLFSPVIAGIMIAAALSAIMSTADSQLLVAAAAVSHDLRLSTSEGTDSDQAQLRRSRLIVLLLCAAAALVALLGSSEIFNSVLFAWSAMGAAFGPLLLVRLFWGRPRPGFAIAAMASGFCLAVGAHLMRADLGSAAGALERVLPFVVAGVLAWWGRPSTLGSASSDVLSP